MNNEPVGLEAQASERYELRVIEGGMWMSKGSYDQFLVAMAELLKYKDKPGACVYDHQLKMRHEPEYAETLSRQVQL